MSFEIAHPLRLLVFPACALLVAFTAYKLRSRSRRERISHILRYVLLLLSALAFAGTSLRTPSPDRTAWLLLDASASVNEEETISLVRDALRESGGNRKTGIIVFGRHAAVEKSIGSTAEWTGIHVTTDRSGSDLGEALSLAAASLSPVGSSGLLSRFLAVSASTGSGISRRAGWSSLLTTVITADPSRTLAKANCRLVRNSS